MNLSVDQAVDALTAAPSPAPEAQEQPAPEVAPEEAAHEAEPEIPADDQPVGDEPGAEEPAGSDEAEQPEPETPAVEPPHYWSKERKEAFSALPADLQAALKEEWESGEKTHQQRMREAADARKQADAAAKEASGLRDRITQAAELAEAKFENRWAGITEDAWLALARDKPEDYTRLRAQFDAEQRVLQQAQSARKEADKNALDAWNTEQAKLLEDLSPELTDKDHGHARKGEVATYLADLGRKLGASDADIAKEIDGVSAIVAHLAYKALQYDRGMAKIAAPARPAPSRPTVKSAPAEQGSSQERTVKSAQSKFAKSGSVDDAVAVLMARKGK